MRGNAFEAKVRAGGGAELLRLLGADAPGEVRTPDLSAAGPEGRTARTALALREATAAGAWTLLDHPLLALEVAGPPVYLEPDAVVSAPGRAVDGRGDQVVPDDRRDGGRREGAVRRPGRPRCTCWRWSGWRR